MSFIDGISALDITERVRSVGLFVHEIFTVSTLIWWSSKTMFVSILYVVLGACKSANS